LLLLSVAKHEAKQKLSENATIITEASHKMDIHNLRLDMVNNPIHSNVTFMVGQIKSTPIRAHTVVLMMHSEVFKIMFAGDFAVLEEIQINDMEPDVFLEMMKYIYAGPDNFNLTITNMIGLQYGAQKYMLTELKKMCEEFILKNTNNTNLLEVFDASQLFENNRKSFIIA
jgi:hypothetical protein